MNLLGSDPGSKCGWAILEGDTRIASGGFDLTGSPREGGGMRILRLRHYLSQVFALYPVDAIGYESVVRHQGVAAAHVYGAIVGALTSMAEEREIPYQGIAVGAHKKAFCGKGNASKSASVHAAAIRYSVNVSHDEADALSVAFTLTEELSAKSPIPL